MTAVPRRAFFKTTLAAGAAAGLPGAAFGRRGQDRDALAATYATLDAAAAKPVLKRELFPDRLELESVELLRLGGNFLCRARTTGGAEGYAVSHNYRMPYLHPIAVQRVLPYFAGRDARDLDALIDGVYLFNNNYKLQNLALWIGVATAELAILDLLGRVAGKGVAELVGERRRERVKVYRANNQRGKSAEETVEIIRRRVEQTGAEAVKFKVGGRMGAAERPAGRTDRLIPLMAEAFPDKVLYADCNGAYDAAGAIRVGEVLDEYGVDLLEGPVPFDWYDSIVRVSEAVRLPVAGGGQEASLRNFRWLIARGGFQVYQQDLFYFGGVVRCMRVARMAAAAGYTCTPHISGTGLGYVYMLQFVAALANAGPYHEFKGVNRDIPFDCPTSSLTPEAGTLKIPGGPGWGVTLDPKWVGEHRVLR